MTRTGQAVVTVGKEFSIGEYTVPDPAPGTVLLQQELGGICGTDHSQLAEGDRAGNDAGTRKRRRDRGPGQRRDHRL